jgi:hypothetical protein
MFECSICVALVGVVTVLVIGVDAVIGGIADFFRRLRGALPVATLEL